MIGATRLALAAAAGCAALVVAPPNALVRVLPSATETWVGRPVVVNVVASNLGGADVSGVSLSITVGGTAEPRVIGVTAEGGDCTAADSAHVTCAIAQLPRARTARVRLQFQPALPGTIEVSSHVSAPGDANAGDDDATAGIAVHPGRQGAPVLRASGRVNGAIADARDLRIARVQGRFDVSEPGRVTLQVVERRSGATIPVLAGSSIGTMKLTSRRTTVTVAVGTPRTTAMTRMLYDLRLPSARLHAGRVYRVVVEAVDLEGQRSTPLVVGFELRASGT